MHGVLFRAFGLARLLASIMIDLFPFQKTGSRFLQSHRYCMLADEMGLGKTPQAIDASRRLSRVLVICPAVAKYNWKAEFLKFAGRSAQVVDSKNPLASRTAIASFDTVRLYADWFFKFRWDVIIVDEAHFLKEPSSKRTQTILGSKGLIHNSDRLWALSGTPAPNHAGELWVWLKTFGYTKLSYDGFTTRYCRLHNIGGHYGRVQIAGSNTTHTPELKSLIKKMALRRLKKDVLDLPPVFHNTFEIQGDDDGFIFKCFPTLKEKLRSELETIKEKFGIDLHDIDDDKLLETLPALSQSISSLRRYHGLKKIKPVADLIIDELSLGLYKKIIIFGIHSDVLTHLCETLRVRSIHTLLVTGKTPAKTRIDYQNFFQATSSPCVFIGNIQAAGTNLTLTAANQVGFIEQDWVPGNNQQAADRAHRYGQTSSVNVRHFAVRDSIDSKIVTALTRKISELATFID